VKWSGGWFEVKLSGRSEVEWTELSGSESESGSGSGSGSSGTG
jgi:hypothetical protein